MLYLFFFYAVSMSAAAVAESGVLHMERPVVGAIRWDAWHGEASEAGRHVERTLSPAHWHGRLPFFARVTGENSVEVRGDTQKIMDQEIEYARQAGLDYWAFVIYPEDNALSRSLHLYLSSEHNGDIRFCLNLQGGWESKGGLEAWKRKTERYVGYMKHPSYQTVCGGRPLIYLFTVEGLVGPQGFKDWQEARDAMNQLRQAAMEAGLPNPYMAVQGWHADTLKEQCELLGFDAISAYASTAQEEAGSYRDLMRHTERMWESFKAAGKAVIPLATSGWDMRPRVETPVPWVQGGNLKQYYEAPTPEELAEHMGNALQWCRDNHGVAEAQCVLMYAWNEFDEGGWLCPTLAEGTARIDALAGVLKQVKAATPE